MSSELPSDILTFVLSTLLPPSVLNQFLYSRHSCLTGIIFPADGIIVNSDFSSPTDKRSFPFLRSPLEDV
ncbi:hypothetical protein L1987_49496 [Smallanthus sonchifolius]|uniref:Uncharacterized protein n=1 Tax=Smallanthus sonchifolius TaxID=185202 RepID=A0ACB9FUN9_9ASTR|nr:hypothetical protein L1987_49496 [Smallanthus sonchifolius]